MGFWKTLGKIGAFAAPIVAAPFTGGTSLALLGAGSGAAGAALSGAKGKGILAGAGLGAIPGVGKLAGADKLLGKVGGAIGGKVGSQVAEKAGGGALSKIFGSKGLDPMMLAMMGLSAFGGGDDGGQQRQSYRAPGQIQDPIQQMQNTLTAIYRLGQGLQERRPVQLRSSTVQQGPKPVQIPGMPFQIGGGLGVDPALADPSLLMSQGRNLDVAKYDPFQGIGTEGFRQPAAGAAGAGQPATSTELGRQRRKPA